MSSASDPAIGVFTITPSDTVDIVYPAVGSGRGFHVNVSGDISAIFSDGSSAILSVLSGVTYPYRLKRVNVTGTTASGIFALV